MTVTWGIVANSHDASIAVWNDGIAWAGLSKDFSGTPNDPHLNEELIQHAWNNYGRPDEIVWYERPVLKTLRQLWAGQGWLLKENNIESYLERYHIYGLPIHYVQHHLSHAAYAYYTQPHDDCAVICLDSIGEFETLTVWHGRNGKLEKLHSQGYPHSLGLFYSAMTQRMGLTPQRDEYLVSERAAKGDPVRLWSAVTNELIDIDHDSNRLHIRTRENLHRGCLWWRPELRTEQDLYDLAAATQEIFCYAVKTVSNWAQWRTGSKNLALAGGGALNRDAVARIAKDWDNTWVPPKPGDPGSAVGCILARKQQHISNINTVWHQ